MNEPSATPWNPKWTPILSVLLKEASDHFSNHGCNDFDLKEHLDETSDRRALMKAVDEWGGDGWDEERYGMEFRWAMDFALMGFFARRVVPILNAHDALVAACKAATKLPDLAILAEEASGSHYHSQRRADEYAGRVRAVLEQINAALKLAETQP